MTEPPTERINPDAARLESMAEFAAGAGHEINNPLATIIGRAQQLLKDEPNPQRRQMLQSIGAQAYRIRDMIGDAMLFGRPPQPEFQPVVLAEAIASITGKLAGTVAAASCQTRLFISTELAIHADPTQLSIVISELIRNSCHALEPSGGDIVIRASKFSEEYAEIEVEDSGCGFSEQERIHAFDPFFSGRQAGRGLGFGLPKCWQIVRMHGGTMEIHSPPRDPATPGRTIVRVRWPLSSGSERLE